jgi:hypothetical protein
MEAGMVGRQPVTTAQKEKLRAARDIDPAQGTGRRMSSVFGHSDHMSKGHTTMSTGFTFPLALCKAQWSVWLHTLEMLETSAAQCLALGSHSLRDSVAETRAETDAIMQAEDWQALAMAPVNAFWRTAAGQASTAFAFYPAGTGDTASPAAQGRPAVAAGRSTADATPRHAVVADALRTLNTALASTPPRKKP